MNDYERKQEQRRQRLAARAQRKDAEAHAARARSDEILSIIPPGQPVLVGHHSEKRHRRDLERSRRAMHKSIDAAQAAADLRSQAAAVGHAGISSDDPDAIMKLQEQLSRAEAEQARMVQINKLLRQGDRAGLTKLGFNESWIDRAVQPDEMGRVGYYAPYQITNNGANIRRLKVRIAALPQIAEQEEAFTEITGDGWRIYAEDNRICIHYDERTSKEQYKALRSHGFMWSPSRNAFVRKFSTQAIHWARHIVGAVNS
jgi:Domain of unknown function (DUF3560)